MQALIPRAVFVDFKDRALAKDTAHLRHPIHHAARAIDEVVRSFPIGSALKLVQIIPLPASEAQAEEGIPEGYPSIDTINVITIDKSGWALTKNGALWPGV